MCLGRGVSGERKSILKLDLHEKLISLDQGELVVHIADTNCPTYDISRETDAIRLFVFLYRLRRQRLASVRPLLEDDNRRAFLKRWEEAEGEFAWTAAQQQQREDDEGMGDLNKLIHDEDAEFTKLGDRIKAIEEEIKKAKKE